VAQKDMDGIMTNKPFISVVQEGDKVIKTVRAGGSIIQKIYDGDKVIKRVTRGDQVIETVTQGDVITKKIQNGDVAVDPLTTKATPKAISQKNGEKGPLDVDEGELASLSSTLLNNSTIHSVRGSQSESNALRKEAEELAVQVEQIKVLLGQARLETQQWKTKVECADKIIPMSCNIDPSKPDDASPLMVLLRNSQREAEEMKTKYEKLKEYIDLGNDLGLMNKNKP
jgi:hypothetical protein